MAETLVKLAAGNGLSFLVLLVRLLFLGVGVGVWIGVVGAAGGGVQTSCWVLKEQASRVPGFGWVWWLFFLVQSGLVTKLLLRGCVVAVRVRGWPLFENCTVDASIFVVKLSRADGECLGTRSR